jgi:hypothetical protein
MVAGAVAVLGVAGGFSQGGGPSGPCDAPITTPSTFAELDLTHATDIWAHFPNFRGAPELGDIVGPVHVVAYDGCFPVPLIGRVGSQPPPNGFYHVLRVKAANGQGFTYANVSYDGYRP